MTTRSPFLTPRAFSALANWQTLASSSAVGDLGDLAVVGLEDDGGLVAQAALDVAVQAVVRDVERAVLEPLEERRVARVSTLVNGFFQLTSSRARRAQKPS
jgi:hypothetical protein